MEGGESNRPALSICFADNNAANREGKGRVLCVHKPGNEGEGKRERRFYYVCVNAIQWRAMPAPFPLLPVRFFMRKKRGKG